MKTYCVKCRKDTENIDSKMFRTKYNRLIMQSKCPVCRIKKSRFVKEAKLGELENKIPDISNLATKTELTTV